MKHRQRPLLTALALAVAASAGLVAPGSAHAAPATCEGKAVTIVATKTVTQGTEGDDVIAMEPSGWNTFDALGGDDTICLAVGAAYVNDRDSVPPSGFLDAGAGDDVVVNLTPSGTTGIFTTVVLGLGNDTFRGADVGETVHAERQVTDLETLGQDVELVGAQRDVVTGAATVWSFAPIDGPNTDRITFGTRPARAVLDGRLSAEGLLDLSAASDATLELPSPARLRPVPYGIVTVDNVTRSVDASGTALTWVGDIDTFRFGFHRRPVDATHVSFRGTERDEAVTFADVPPGDVAMGSGDDKLVMAALNSTWVPLTADGGPGHDEAYLSAVCRRAFEVRLDRFARCDGQSGTFTGFRDVIVNGSRATTLIGTDRSERLVASGDTVVVKGFGGDDEIAVDDSWSARVFAGAGADRLWVSGDDVVARGQSGRDRIKLYGSAGLDPSGRSGSRRQVALGGRGADVMIGTTRGNDRLVGGPGKDRANGRKGRRDYCSAEITTRCERP